MYGVLRLSLRRMITCKILIVGIVLQSQDSEENVAVKGQALFLVKVKGQGPFSILTNFDRGRRWEYRRYGSDTPLSTFSVYSK